jgi:hypothetical protein
MLTVNAKNEKGTPLHFWVLNDFEGIAPIDLNLFANGDSIFFLPPMEKNAIAYSFHVDNIAIGSEESRNTLNSVEAVRIPYDYLVNLHLSNPYTIAFEFTTFTTSHPNESLYTAVPVNIKNGKSLIVLSQSYDSGWQAYAGKKTFWSTLFPFFTGKKLTHVKVNNWENGWIVDSTTLSKRSQITMVYLPQYLEYFGFFAFVFIMLTFILKPATGTVNPLFRKLNAFFEKRAQFFKNLVFLRLHKTIH